MKQLILSLILLISFASRAQSWFSVDLNTSKDLYDVHFLDTANGWLVGSDGAIFRYFDETWYEEEAVTDSSLNAVFMVDPNDVWIAGNGGNIFHYTSSGILPVSSPTTKRLNDIYMLNSEKGWIAGEDGTLLVYDGVSWQNDTIIPSHIFPNHLETDDLLQIDFFNDDFGIVIGEWGIYLEYKNGMWTDTSSINTQSFTSVEIMDTNIVAVGGFESNPLINSCFIFIYNGGGIFLYFSIGWPGGTGHITSMKVIDNKGWAILTDGNILKYNGSEFIPFENKSAVLNSLSLYNPINGWIAGNAGTLLHFDPRPSIHLGEDRSFCEGDTSILTPGTGYIEYLWSTGEVTDSILVTEPGEYWVEVINEYGYSDRDTILLTTFPKPGTPQIIAGPTTVDNFENAESTFTSSESASAEQYEWNLVPAEAGTISASGTTATVTWTAGYTGTPEISVRGLNANCDGDYSAGFPVTVYSSQGLEEDNNDVVRILPNPTTGTIRIFGDDILTTKVFTPRGEVIYSGNSFNIDLSDQKNGIYIIVIVTQQRTFINKIIKE